MEESSRSESSESMEAEPSIPPTAWQKRVAKMKREGTYEEYRRKQNERKKQTYDREKAKTQRKLERNSKKKNVALESGSESEDNAVERGGDASDEQSSSSENESDGAPKTQWQKRVERMKRKGTYEESRRKQNERKKQTYDREKAKTQRKLERNRQNTSKKKNTALESESEDNAVERGGDSSDEQSSSSENESDGVPKTQWQKRVERMKRKGTYEESRRKQNERKKQKYDPEKEKLKTQRRTERRRLNASKKKYAANESESDSDNNISMSDEKENDASDEDVDTGSDGIAEDSKRQNENKAVEMDIDENEDGNSNESDDEVVSDNDNAPLVEHSENEQDAPAEESSSSASNHDAPVEIDESDVNKANESDVEVISDDENISSAETSEQDAPDEEGSSRENDNPAVESVEIEKDPWDFRVEKIKSQKRRDKIKEEGGEKYQEQLRKDEERNKIRRPRGRPKKVVTPKTDSESENDERNKIRRPRGRPKKVVTPKTDSESKNDERNKIRRPRGRPKKVVTPKTDSESENDGPAKTYPQKQREKMKREGTYEDFLSKARARDRKRYVPVRALSPISHAILKETKRIRAQKHRDTRTLDQREERRRLDRERNREPDRRQTRRLVEQKRRDENKKKVVEQKIEDNTETRAHYKKLWSNKPKGIPKNPTGKPCDKNPNWVGCPHCVRWWPTELYNRHLSMHSRSNNILRNPLTMEQIQETEYGNRISGNEWERDRENMMTGTRLHRVTNNRTADLSQIAYEYSRSSAAGHLPNLNVPKEKLRMVRGLDMENRAILIFALLTGWNIKDIIKPGLIRHLFLKWLAATPDALYMDNFLLEMKNTEREFPLLVGTILIRSRDGRGGVFLGPTPLGMDEQTVYALNPNHTYHAQIIAQLVCTGREIGKFVILSAQDSVPYVSNGPVGSDQHEAWLRWSRSMPRNVHMWTQTFTLEEARDIFRDRMLPQLINFYQSHMAAPSLPPGIPDFTPGPNELVSQRFVPLQFAPAAIPEDDMRYAEHVANRLRIAPDRRSSSIIATSNLLSGVETTVEQQSPVVSALPSKQPGPTEIEVDSEQSSDHNSDKSDGKNDVNPISDAPVRRSSRLVTASNLLSGVETTVRQPSLVAKVDKKTSSKNLEEIALKNAKLIALKFAEEAARKKEADYLASLEADELARKKEEELLRKNEENMARALQASREKAERIKREKEKLKRNYSEPQVVNLEPQPVTYQKRIQRNRQPLGQISQPQLGQPISLPQVSSTGLSQQLSGVAVSSSKSGAIVSSQQQGTTQAENQPQSATTEVDDSSKDQAVEKAKSESPSPPLRRGTKSRRVRNFISSDDNSSEENQNTSVNDSSRSNPARTPPKRSDERMDSESNILVNTPAQQQHSYVQRLIRHFEEKLQVSQKPLHPSELKKRNISKPLEHYNRKDAQSKQDDPMAVIATVEIQSRTFSAPQIRSSYTPFEQRKLEAEKREELSKVQPNIQNPQPPPIGPCVPARPAPVPTTVPRVPPRQTPVVTTVSRVPTTVPARPTPAIVPCVPARPAPVPTTVPRVPPRQTPVPTTVPRVPPRQTPVPTAVPRASAIVPRVPPRQTPVPTTVPRNAQPAPVQTAVPRASAIVTRVRPRQTPVPTTVPARQTAIPRVAAQSAPVPAIVPRVPAIVPRVPAVVPRVPAIVPRVSAIVPVQPALAPAIVPRVPAIVPRVPAIVPRVSAIVPVQPALAPAIVPRVPAIVPRVPAIVPRVPAVVPVQPALAPAIVPRVTAQPGPVPAIVPRASVQTAGISAPLEYVPLASFATPSHIPSEIPRQLSAPSISSPRCQTPCSLVEEMQNLGICEAEAPIQAAPTLLSELKQVFTSWRDKRQDKKTRKKIQLAECKQQAEQFKAEMNAQKQVEKPMSEIDQLIEAVHEKERQRKENKKAMKVKQERAYRCTSSHLGGFQRYTEENSQPAYAKKRSSKASWKSATGMDSRPVEAFLFAERTLNEPLRHSGASITTSSQQQRSIRSMSGSSIAVSTTPELAMTPITTSSHVKQSTSSEIVFTPQKQTDKIFDSDITSADPADKLFDTGINFAENSQQRQEPDDRIRAPTHWTW